MKPKHRPMVVVWVLVIAAGCGSIGGYLAVHDAYRAFERGGEGIVYVKGFMIQENDGPVLLCDGITDEHPPEGEGDCLEVSGWDMPSGAREKDQTRWYRRPLGLKGILSRSQEGQLSLGDATVTDDF